MKPMAFKPLLYPSILGLVMSGVVVTATTVNAAEDILNDAIHDYSSNTWGSFADTATYDRNIYHTRILLDQSYHDYVSEDVAAFDNTPKEMEQAEFAAFEEAAITPIPWVISSQRSW